MIKYSVMYPNKPGARFDHTYYLEKHMPLVKERMGKYLQSYAVSKGVAGGAPGEPAPYLVICDLVCKSVDDFRAGFGPHAKEIIADIANYTDIAPQTQLSEIAVG